MLSPDHETPAPSKSRPTFSFERFARVHPNGVPNQLGTVIGPATDEQPGLVLVRWDHQPSEHPPALERAARLVGTGAVA